MYKLDEIQTLHIELTTGCQAACPMCDRTHRDLTTTNVTYEQFKEWFPKSFIKQLDMLIICGNYGDAVVNPHTIDIIRGVRKQNKDIVIQFHTNGSARDVRWWKRLARYNVDVIFAIDGLEDTHSIYRINTDFRKIRKNATAFISAGGFAHWHMLLFEHNEHQMISAKMMSEQLGFKSFKVKYTTRFENGQFEGLAPASTYVDTVKPGFCMVEKWKHIYVDAHGNLFPCPYTAFLDYKHELPYSNLNDTTLEKVFDTDYFDDVKLGWFSEPLTQCKEICGMCDEDC